MGCQQSAQSVVEDAYYYGVTGVGSTERMVSRAQRLAGKELSPPPKLDASGRLTMEEVVRRTTCSIRNKATTLGTADNRIHVQYAHWSQRGYYPDDPHKENQDEFGVVLDFASECKPAGVEKGCGGGYFGVYDGHGMHGHDCSRFAKTELPFFVAKHIRKVRMQKYKRELELAGKSTTKLFEPEKWPYLDEKEYKECCEAGFLECNQAMHKDKNVDDSCSGTTAITAMFHGNLFTVCNVGDSRAILGHRIHPTTNEKQIQPLNPQDEDCVNDENDDDEETKEEERCSVVNVSDDTTVGTNSQKAPLLCHQSGKLLAIPLSRDQTPYRRDERERVKKLGATIMSMDQMEGREEMHENWGDSILTGDDSDIHRDPPRVWVEGKDYPGAAFTRSLGDHKAKAIGVSAQPEMISRQLTKNDQILVIASDGVFEFLTNQDVIDLCAQCDSALTACEKVVRAAYDQWLNYERRTDDITVIVCFLTCVREPSTDGSEGTTEDLVGLAKSIYGNKPLRRHPRIQDESVRAFALDVTGGNATRISVFNEKAAMLNEIPLVMDDETKESSSRC